ncbi:MAG: hypothetical protein HYZ49_09860 [Chloroflexi bacterium]|nr:hypothetical protein [Chloroflexota bacterium]
MTPPTLPDYLELRLRFAVTREAAQGALNWAQPLAMETLGVHTQRQTLVEGELPAYLVMTTPETNGGWSELMPLWFKPYERPVPLHCLDNWALFALLYRSAFGSDADTPAFAVENLARVIIGADLLIPFLPGTDGAGRFLRHGALPILLAILWLESEVRDAWLALHECGGQIFVAENNLRDVENLNEWLERIENEAWLAPEREAVASEAAVATFLADPTRFTQYSALFGGLCLSVAALAAALGSDWRQWVFPFW